MNILFISQYFYPEPFSNNDIAQALAKRGHEVEAVVCVPNYPEGEFYPGFSNRERRTEMWNNIHILRAFTVARGKRPVTLLLNYLTYVPSAIWTIFSKGRGDYSVSFCSMPSPVTQCIVAIAMKFGRGVPSIFWVQDIWPDSLVNTLGIKNRFVKVALHKFCALLYRQADIVMIQSEAFRPKLEAMGVEGHRLVYFPNTAPDDAPGDLPDADRLKIKSLFPATPLRLMFAGNVGESQNLDIILHAAARLRERFDIQWVIVGSGRDLERLKALADKLEVNDIVLFAGRHPMQSMPAFFERADAMIVSLKNTEIFHMTIPFKLQSYMKAGKPVIGSISGETMRIIDEARMGFCAEADDIDAFCVAVEKFAALSQDERNQCSENAHRYFMANFAPDHIYGLLERHLQSVAK